MSDDKKKKEVEEKEEVEIKDEEQDECGCKNRCEELENQVKRVLADYQNLEKRTIEDKKNWIRIANKELLLRLLPVLDTLILASKHVKNDGLELSIKQFQDVLKEEGLIRVETTGCKFNPETMECVETVEGEEGKVIVELSAGYLLNDKLLRPARVKVGK
ncbi:MAG: nucleotide exchange factor GrpE [Candidatus Levybacteria bacterium]|nr:nucleotide exchange factor GrpE [Candidatus Levybacteria bacterium]